ncbi:MAG: CinA family protein [Clostridia bacterium]|nr:CinA family protein [Clostridia bacterium]MBO5777923.1 CinA family protein [Clostridia bacterium]
MIQEVVKICGLDIDTIRLKLSEFLGMGVTFDVEEKCLDAKITMTSAGTRESFDQIKAYVYNAFSEQVYSAEDISLHVLAATLLKRSKKVLSVAESLTGGEICSRLTSVPGISENFYEGIVCYNRHSKMDRLGIPRAFIGEYGTVSRETAHAMVQGLLNRKVDIGLSTTGLAGPTGDEGKPVGLVYIAVGGGEFITTFEKRLSGDRNQVREATANLALFYLVRYLRGDILLL